MINTYPHSSMQDMNLDWLLEVGKQADIDHNEWTHIRGTAQKQIDDAIKDALDSGEIGKVVDGATTKLINDEINPLKDTVAEQGSAINNLAKRDGLFDLSGKTVIIGDSYTVGYTPEGNITPWYHNFVEYCGITDYVVKANSGSGFTADGNTFHMLLNQVPNDPNVKQILVVGGYNEWKGYTETVNAIESFYQLALAKFPNAKIFVAMVAWSVDTKQQPRLTLAKIHYNTQRKNWIYLNGSEYILHSDLFMASDGFHPNVTGQILIARYLAEAVKTGTCHPCFYSNEATPYTPGDFVALGGSEWNILTSYAENTNSIIWDSYGCKPKTTTNIICDGTEYYLGEMRNTAFLGNGYGYTSLPTNVIVESGGRYYHVPAYLVIKARKIYLSMIDVNDDHTNYRTINNVASIAIRKGFATTTTIY